MTTINTGNNLSLFESEAKEPVDTYAMMKAQVLEIPNLSEDQNIGFARTIAFALYVLKENEKSFSNDEFSFEKTDSAIVITPPARDLTKNYNPRFGHPYLKYLFLFLREALSDSYAHDASVDERIFRSATNVLDFFDFDSNIKEKVTKLIEEFYKEASVKDMGIIKAFEKVAGYLTKNLLYAKDSLSKNSRFHRINNNLGFLADHDTRKKFFNKKAGTDEFYKFIQLFVFKTTDVTWEWIIEDLLKQKETEAKFDKLHKYSQEEKQALKKKILRLVNYSDDSTELVNYIKSRKNKKIWNGMKPVRASDVHVYSYAEIHLLTEDKAYKDYRLNKTVKEFNESPSNADAMGELSAGFLKISAKEVVTMLPHMGEYFIDEVSEEQENYVKILINTLANRLDVSDDESSRVSQNIEKQIEKAEKLVKEARSQSSESSLIYGREASRLFLGLSERKIEIIEDSNKKIIIENGQTIDNILIGLIKGFARF